MPSPGRTLGSAPASAKRSRPSSRSAAGSSSSSAPGGASRPSTSSRRGCCATPGAGPTLLVSPLLALMRNQIGMAERAGVVAPHDQQREPRRLGGDRLGDRPRRGRPAPRLARAVQQPGVPRRRPASGRRALGPARDRRGALHQRLGPRLPARLPAARPRPRAAARGRPGAVHHRDGERPRDRGHPGAARRRARDAARPARSGEPRALDARDELAARADGVARPGRARPRGLRHDLRAHDRRHHAGRLVPAHAGHRRARLQRRDGVASAGWSSRTP